MGFQLESNRGGDQLEIAPRRANGDSFLATLALGSLRASLDFDELAIHWLPELFSSAARDWRGWEGERRGESLEGQLALGLSHDGLGTVSVRVRLRELEGPHGEWSAEGILHVDAGALDRIARHARDELT